MNLFIRNIINIIEKEKSIFYIQPPLTNFLGTDFFADGAERYAIELNRILTTQGYDFYCIQYCIGEPWIRNYNGLTIIGLPSLQIIN